MKARALVLLVLVHVSLDLGSPWVQGAFTFDPDDSIDSTSVRRPIEAPPTGPTSSVRPATVSETVPPVALRMEIGRPVEGWVAELRRAHGPSGEPPPSPDDH